ncbi:MAG: hypothetical protein JNN13_19225 [Planctomycetes bacterium]|nr:hypothetical protein [Planctomycetota bacterium]
MVAILVGSTAPDHHPAGEEKGRTAIDKAYAAMLRPLDSGCTPTLRKWYDGSISWGGCPNAQCTDFGCVADGSDSDEMLSCHCQDGGPGVKCKGVVIFSEWGLVVDWDCPRASAPNGCPAILSCVKQEDPEAPESNYVAFATCSCE